MPKKKDKLDEIFADKPRHVNMHGKRVKQYDPNSPPTSVRIKGSAIPSVFTPPPKRSNKTDDDVKKTTSNADEGVELDTSGVKDWTKKGNKWGKQLLAEQKKATTAKRLETRKRNKQVKQKLQKQHSMFQKALSEDQSPFIPDDLRQPRDPNIRTYGKKKR